MGRADFDRQFILYRKNLHAEIERFHGFVAVFVQLQARRGDHLDQLNLAPAFFGYVENALFSSIVLRADKMASTVGSDGWSLARAAIPRDAAGRRSKRR
ncbi:MAG TPA: hypothetical protein VFB54_02670 [Burkholderiales bacterium]|nr:hypothetical protein [Burkholderiales bacterium]